MRWNGHKGWTLPWTSPTSLRTSSAVSNMWHMSSDPCLNFKLFPSRTRTPCLVNHALCHSVSLTRCGVRANSLCILDWSGRDFFPQLHQLEELLRDLPNLCVLHCPELVWADGSIPSSILSSVTAVAVARLVERVGHPGEGGLHEACVSLREFIYYGCELPRELIMHYGKYLTVVKWCHS